MQNPHIHFQAFTPATASIYRQPQPPLMRAKPRGTVEVVLNRVFPDLTKDLSFSYIPALPPCFSCMNKGHLKWFGLETKEGLWGMNPTHREQLKMCVYPSAGVWSLSLISPVLWRCINMAFTRDFIISILLLSFLQLSKMNHFLFPNYSSCPGGLWVSSFPPTNMRSGSCDLDTTPVQINLGTDGRETAEMEQPAGFFHLFGDLGISWIVACCLFL